MILHLLSPMVSGMKFLAIAISLLLTEVLVGAHTHSEGVDMSTDGSTSLAMGNMVPYLHFTPGDTIWFKEWVPMSTGAMIGTCIGLFLLAIVDRWTTAISSTVEIRWSKKTEINVTQKLGATTEVNKESQEPLLSTRSPVMRVLALRDAQHSTPAHDIARGVFHMGQAALGYLFILAIMTF